MPPVIRCGDQERAELLVDGKECREVVPIAGDQSRSVPEGELGETRSADQYIGSTGIAHETGGVPRIGSDEGRKHDVRFCALGRVDSADRYGDQGVQVRFVLVGCVLVLKLEGLLDQSSLCQIGAEYPDGISLPEPVPSVRQQQLDDCVRFDKVDIGATGK
jgi:hypothetical protein